NERTRRMRDGQAAEEGEQLTDDQFLRPRRVLASIPIPSSRGASHPRRSPDPMDRARHGRWRRNPRQIAGAGARRTGSELMGILGRPRRRKDGAVSLTAAGCATAGVALLRRQMTGSDPVLARVAEEALRAEAPPAEKRKVRLRTLGFCAGFNASICALPPAQVQRYP